MIRSDETLPFDYEAIRREVVRHIPALEGAIAEEERLTDMHVEPALAYPLIEDVVWPHLRRAAAGEPDDVRPYGNLIASMMEHGDRDVRGLAIIGLLEHIDYRRSVREALVSAGFAYLLDELA